MAERAIETRRGIKCRVREAGTGAPLLFLHGAGGLFPQEPLLEQLSHRFHVFAPTWPGWGPEAGEEQLEDMLDFALHGWDVAEALGLERPHLVGHSMGGMIAAEMAAVNNQALEKLALIAPTGVWLDDHPIPDLFGMTPFELPALLFAVNPRFNVNRPGVPGCLERRDEARNVDGPFAEHALRTE